MGRNEFDAHRSLAVSGNRWKAPKPMVPNHTLRSPVWWALAVAIAVVALVGGLSALGVV